MRWMKLAGALGLGALALGVAIIVALFVVPRWRAPAKTPAATGRATAKSGRKILYWWDPMLGPSSIADKPGKSAMGMDRVPVYAGQTPAGPGIEIDPAVVQNMGVRTAVVVRGPLTKTIRAVGLVTIPEWGMHDVALKVGGWIDKLDADENGMHVMAGEVLFEVYSPALQVAEQELISAEQAKRSLGADADPEVRRDAQGLIDSARQKLRLWDVAEQDIDAIARADRPPRDVPFRAPATGHVDDKVIVQGSAVTAGMRLLRIVDHQKVWLNAEVYEDNIPLVKLGDEMVGAVDATPGRMWRGKIDFIYPHLDAQSRTLTVRTTISTPDFLLKPGMYADVRIITAPVLQTLQVPAEAVIDTGTRQFVFLVQGHGHFMDQTVRVGIRGDHDMVQILSGLTAGQKVVTSGQFLMDVESRTNEAIEKMREPSTPPGDRESGGRK